MANELDEEEEEGGRRRARLSLRCLHHDAPRGTEGCVQRKLERFVENENMVKRRKESREEALA